jgi:hypothetical protein
MVVAGSGYEDVAARTAEFALRQRWITATDSILHFLAGLLIYYGPTLDEFVRLNERNLDIITRSSRAPSQQTSPSSFPPATSWRST